MKIITAFLLVLLMAAPVLAQGIIPRERPATSDREGKFSGDIARKVMDQFAACVLDRRRKLVSQALALPSDSPEQNELYGSLAKAECTSSVEVHFYGPNFRGSLYKALVRKKFGRKDVFPASAADAQQAIPEGTGPGETGLLNFARCVVHKDPKNARDAILSAAGSPKEDEAMAALANVYGRCLYEDTKIRFSKGSLIGFLAEAYYRDASALAEESAAR